VGVGVCGRARARARVCTCVCACAYGSSSCVLCARDIYCESFKYGTARTHMPPAREEGSQ